MKRKTFLGALLGLVALPKAAKAVQVEPRAGGLSGLRECLPSTSVEGLSRTTLAEAIECWGPGDTVYVLDGAVTVHYESVKWHWGSDFSKPPFNGPAREKRLGEP